MCWLDNNTQMMCLLEETKERAGCPPPIHQSPRMSSHSSPLNRQLKEGMKVWRTQRWKYQVMPKYRILSHCTQWNNCFQTCQLPVDVFCVDGGKMIFRLYD